MSTWYVRVTTFEHYRVEAPSPEAAGDQALTQVPGPSRGPDFVQTEILGFDVSTTDDDGDPVGEAAVAGGEYPPEEISGKPAGGEIP